MATQFETLLVGDDEEHLAAVAEAMLDEVSRIERLLSRFDAASEISRINREAAGGEVLVDREVFAILQLCERYWQQTDGYFDVAAKAWRGNGSEQEKADGLQIGRAHV